LGYGSVTASSPRKRTPNPDGAVDFCAIVRKRTQGSKYLDVNECQVTGIERAIASLDRGEAVPHGQVKEWVTLGAAAGSGPARRKDRRRCDLQRELLAAYGEPNTVNHLIDDLIHVTSLP
jgi:hypothetical protein